ncbi:MAG: PTS sugar transporter subunit IIA [Thermoguttaceae bacterium]|nr:PTS sugar transporter subunit IIA [Thermoguttaceae bacterium]
MKFADFICNESLNANLKATTKEGAIREMVESLVNAGQLPKENYEDIVHNVLKREELGSTGIGRCVAVPHTKFDVKKMVGTVSVSPNGVDFDSLDGQPVRVLFMLISPLDQPQEHLLALEHIAKQLREDTFRRFMMQAKNQADIIELLSDADANQFTV